MTFSEFDLTVRESIYDVVVAEKLDKYSVDRIV